MRNHPTPNAVNHSVNYRKADGTPTERATNIIDGCGPIVVGAGLSCAITFAYGCAPLGYPHTAREVADFGAWLVTSQPPDHGP